MSANPIIYCLESLTDYREFERLCSDLMAGSGYAQIEPIGGTGDRGRDAISLPGSGSLSHHFAPTGFLHQEYPGDLKTSGHRRSLLMDWMAQHTTSCV